MQGGGGWGRLAKVGGGAFVTPRLHDRLDYLVPRHASSQLRGKRGRRTCDLWHAAHGCNDLLRAIEQDRPMLQECASLPDLCRAHQLATRDEYLAADRSREAGAQADGRTGGRSVWCERGRDTERAYRRREACVDRMVRRAQAPERRDRGGHRVGHLIL